MSFPVVAGIALSAFGVGMVAGVIIMLVALDKNPPDAVARDADSWQKKLSDMERDAWQRGPASLRGYEGGNRIGPG